MNTFNDNGYGASVAALDYRTRQAAAPDPGREVVADGGRVRVPMALMDSVQREIAEGSGGAA